MKKVILFAFVLFTVAAVAQPDSIVSLVNSHTDSVVMAASDTLLVTAHETQQTVGWGWKVIAGILVVAEVVLRVVPTKNSATLLGLVSWLHSIIPNNVRKKKD